MNCDSQLYLKSEKKKQHVIGALAVILEAVYVQVGLLACVFLFDAFEHLVQELVCVVEHDCVPLPIVQSLH